MGRIEVLNEDEGHADIGGQRIEELSAGVEAASRGANPDDREFAGGDRIA
jgi:hypothetical protein